ncbi:helix-turn-helix transcriptional regulator [Actinoplanes oblitus]|uniref:Helix-turn-helix transcriptional regulator n=1 Tax=Actinoplanes oblitus TaxID=3040509 RepID=A0ABY8WLA6_9ACTN|nr:helix-turn-helix transcriptional regulator [Actinoplanes oblitus]WIM97801.1 helix-turn-helix transcriptional regulator [Actinoplanes oblitus]
MADLDPAVALANWALFVDRWLRAVRSHDLPPAQRLTDRKIYELSGISTSTLSRWRNAKGTQLPELDRVQAFCRVVGAPIDDAMAALGLTREPPQATPEMPVPADVQIILRKLVDPNTSAADRAFIVQSLQVLANHVRATAHRKPEAS